MKETTKFFWERWKRACQMDATNKLLGKPTHVWIQADEWISAYKATLSKSKQNEFDKEWNKLEEEHQKFLDATPKQMKNMTSPLMKGL